MDHLLSDETFYDHEPEQRFQLRVRDAVDGLADGGSLFVRHFIFLLSVKCKVPQLQGLSRHRNLLPQGQILSYRI